MPAAAGEPWAILAAIPEVVEFKKAKRLFPPGTDISIARNELPQASVITVQPHISFPACLGLYPYVAAADPSGLLLILGTHPITSASVVVSCHICDARTGEAVSLPDQMRPMALSGAKVGLIVKDDGCIVAELVARCDGTGGATLLTYKVGERCMWRERELTCSTALPRDWYPEGVVSHGGMLWWVDLSYGLLACDPFADQPPLLHVPLPLVPDELPVHHRVNRGALRCVKVSGGRLRYVQIHGDSHAPVVSTWALWALAESWEWIPGPTVPLDELWMDQSYIDTMLPRSTPALALLHPTDPNRVYFFLHSSIFAVDLQLRKLVEFNRFEMRDPPRERRLKRSSHFVHAWQYDPASSRSDFVSTCLRQEKAIASKSSFSGIIPIKRRTAKRLKRVWDYINKQEQEHKRAMCYDFKRRCRITEESRISQLH